MESLNNEQENAATFSTLAVQGERFDRARLNFMLHELAASPVPIVPSPPQAMCYSMAEPPRDGPSFEYVCTTCGTHTFYKESLCDMDRELTQLREGAASLRSMGLEISLDESALCRKCRSASELGIPTGGTIIKASEPKKPKPLPWYRKIFQREPPPPRPQGFQVGDIVAIKDTDDDGTYFYVAPASPHYWIKEDDISDTGKVLIPTNLYCKPQVDDVIHASVSSRVILNRLPATPEDPNGWVQVERPDKYSETDDFRDYFIGIGRAYLGEFSYDEPEPSKFRQLKLAWIINGKRIRAEVRDIEIMRSFLKGDKLNHTKEYPLKYDIIRLRKLFGTDLGVW